MRSRSRWSVLLFTAAAMFAAYVPSASARSKFQGYVEQGGLQLRTSGGAVTAIRAGSAVTNPSVQQSYPQATVTVCVTGVSSACNGGAGNLATLYTNSTGTPLANPFTASVNAFWSFYTDQSGVDVRFSGGGITVPYTLTDLAPAVQSSVFIPLLVTDGTGGATATANSTALQAALDAAGAVSGTVDLTGYNGVAVLASEAQIKSTSKSIQLLGPGFSYTATDGNGLVLRAGTNGQRSVLAVLSKYHSLSGFTVDGNSLSSYGVYRSGDLQTRYDNIVATRAKFDGWLLAATGSSGLGTIMNCMGHTNGTLYRTAGIAGEYTNGTQSLVAGTAAVSASGTTVTITSGPDLTTLGIRKGDFIRIGTTHSTAQWLQIELVASATQLTLQTFSAATATVTGQDYAIGVGDGYRQMRDSNNNLDHVTGGMWRSNGGSGIVQVSLFGGTFDGSILLDFNNMFGFVNGHSDGTAVNQTALVRAYFEDNNAAPLWLVLNSSVTLIEPSLQVVLSGPRWRNGPFGATGMIFNGDVAESIGLGKEQNFVVEVRNNGGTIQHRIVSEHWDGFNSLQVDKISGASVTWTNTPTVDSVTDFSTGVGIVSGATHVLLFNTTSAQSATISGVVAVEFNSTNASYVPSITTDSVNVNGTTQIRPALYITTIAAGALQNWNTTTIPAGTSIGVRIRAYMR